MTIREWLEEQRGRRAAYVMIDVVLAALGMLLAWRAEGGWDVTGRVIAWTFGIAALVNLGYYGGLGAVRERLDWKGTSTDDQSTTSTGVLR